MQKKHDEATAGSFLALCWDEELLDGDYLCVPLVHDAFLDGEHLLRASFTRSLKKPRPRGFSSSARTVNIFHILLLHETILFIKQQDNLYDLIYGVLTLEDTIIPIHPMLKSNMTESSISEFKLSPLCN